MGGTLAAYRQCRGAPDGPGSAAVCPRRRVRSVERLRQAWRLWNGTGLGLQLTQHRGQAG